MLFDCMCITCLPSSRKINDGVGRRARMRAICNPWAKRKQQRMVVNLKKKPRGHGGSNFRKNIHFAVTTKCGQGFLHNVPYQPEHPQNRDTFC